MRKALAELPHMHATMPFLNTKLDRQLWRSHLASQLSRDRTGPKFDLDFGVHTNHPM